MLVYNEWSCTICMTHRGGSALHCFHLILIDTTTSTIMIPPVKQLSCARLHILWHKHAVVDSWGHLLRFMSALLSSIQLC